MKLHPKAKLRSFLERQWNREYAARLARAKRWISYEEWLQLAERQGEDSGYRTGILANEPDGSFGNLVDTPDKGTLAERCAAAQKPGFALLKEQGIWLILQQDGYVDPMAFSWIVDYFREHPETLLLYGDEDTLDVTGEHRCSPCFKPDWSPDTWLSCFYLGSVIALRRELVQKLSAGTGCHEVDFQAVDLREMSSQGGASSGMWPQDCEEVLRYARPAQVRILVHQLLELAGGFTRGCCAIAHLRGMLFHMSYDAARAGVQGEYRQEDVFGESVRMPQKTAYALADAAPETIGPDKEEASGEELITISVIIPSKDNPQVLEQCLASLQECQKNIQGTGAATEAMESGDVRRSCRLEIIVVDNGSSPGNKQKIEKITCGMKYIYDPMPFNFSKMCNRGAQEATGEILLFLNDDITVCADGWLEAMADRVLRPYVGAVGLKLYYPDSTKIQHAGITNLPGGPVHKLQFTLDGQEEDYGYGSLDRNVIGVTGACLMVRREPFWQAGGFPEDLQVAYNDVELCFRLREEGWHNVVINRFHAYHHESLSRGSDLTREKMLRLRQERETLYARHSRYVSFDPYYPEPLCRELGDMSVREVYLDIQAGVQVASGSRWLAKCPEQEPENLVFALQPAIETVPQVVSTDYVRDKCFCLQGYLVVRWENNACYERYLLLRRSEETDGAHVIHLEAQYSREAEYGEQEQPNVAMCGFRVMLRKGVLPDGEYQIGMQARSRMGRRRLTAWTERSLRIEGGILSASENLMLAERTTHG